MVVVIVSMCRDSGGNGSHGVVVVVSTERPVDAHDQTLTSESGSGTPSCSYLRLSDWQQ